VGLSASAELLVTVATIFNTTGRVGNINKRAKFQLIRFRFEGYGASGAPLTWLIAFLPN